MLAIAALMLAAISPGPSAGLTSAVPWWERFTFTMSGDGDQQSCQYQTSLAGVAAQGCGDEGLSPVQHRASATNDSYTKITIERRFTPGSAPEPVRLETGDTLLGGQVMALAIDSLGAVRSCEIVGASGEMKPPYGCEEVRTERFESSAARGTAEIRRGFMTVLVYGHEEYPV